MTVTLRSYFLWEGDNFISLRQHSTSVATFVTFISSTGRELNLCKGRKFATNTDNSFIFQNIMVKEWMREGTILTPVSIWWLLTTSQIIVFTSCILLHVMNNKIYLEQFFGRMYSNAGCNKSRPAVNITARICINRLGFGCCSISAPKIYDKVYETVARQRLAAAAADARRLITVARRSWPSPSGRRLGS